MTVFGYGYPMIEEDDDNPIIGLSILDPIVMDYIKTGRFNGCSNNAGGFILEFGKHGLILENLIERMKNAKVERP